MLVWIALHLSSDMGPEYDLMMSQFGQTIPMAYLFILRSCTCVVGVAHAGEGGKHTYPVLSQCALASSWHSELCVSWGMRYNRWPVTRLS